MFYLDFMKKFNVSMQNRAHISKIPNIQKSYCYHPIPQKIPELSVKNFWKDFQEMSYLINTDLSSKFDTFNES